MTYLMAFWCVFFHENFNIEFGDATFVRLFMGCSCMVHFYLGCDGYEGVNFSVIVS